MPDLKAFTDRHVEMAGEFGVATATKNATMEAAMWVQSQTIGRRHRLKEKLIWETDWDICLVADACRWDLYQEVEPDYQWLPDRPSGWSAGSASPEWYGRTFDPSDMPGESIGVVTANPFASKPPHRVEVLSNTPLHQHDGVEYVDYVFEDSWGCDVPNGYLDVTHPSVVTNRAWEAWTEHELDRLVVHYMQPHLPFRSNPEWFGTRPELDTFGELADDYPVGNREGSPYQNGGKEVWKELRDGERERQDVWRAYADNLRWVLDDINRLREAVAGEFLLTSDHGNGLGERGIWSHPPSVQHPALRRVPWVTLSGEGSGELKKVGVNEYSTGDRAVREQLEALGYT